MSKRDAGEDGQGPAVMSPRRRDLQEVTMYRVLYNQRDRASERAVISAIRIDANPRHWWIAVWNRGGKAGDLCVDAADGPAVVNALIPPRDQGERPHPELPAAAGIGHLGLAEVPR
jgi:hypothetical protein